jgi:hypothetical protein
VCLPPGTPQPCALSSDCRAVETCLDNLCHESCGGDGDCDGACLDGHCEGPVLTVGRMVDAGPPPADAPSPVCSAAELAMGRIACGADCVDPTTDPAHCGDCETACAGPCNGGVCAPENDACAAATPISIVDGPVRVVGTGRGATDDSPGSCADGPDVFYSFELTERELVVIRSAAGDAQVGFVNTCGAVADSCGPTTRGDVLAPGSYLLVVDAAGDFEVVIEHIPVTGAPVRRLSPGMDTLGGSTVGAVNTPGTCGAGPDRFYWWLTPVGFPGGDFSASTCAGASFATRLELVHGDGTRSCDAPGGCAPQSFLTAPVPAGAGLHVFFIDGATAGDAGDYSILVTVP